MAKRRVCRMCVMLTEGEMAQIDEFMDEVKAGTRATAMRQLLRAGIVEWRQRTRPWFAPGAQEETAKARRTGQLEKVG